MPTSLQGISKRSREHKHHKFGKLYSAINRWSLYNCFKTLKKKASPGIDKITWNKYYENLVPNLLQLEEKLIKKKYKAKLIRRKLIPKPNGKKRPLGILALEDKIVQATTTKILTAIYDPIFLQNSFGYRPKVGAKDAVRVLTGNLQCGKYGYIVETDIKGFFDNIDHDWLIKMLEEKIKDKPFINLIRKWLKAGILHEDGKVTHPITGTPQGGIVSPVLANVYLHYVIDIWFEKIIKPKCQGKAMMIRFADDVIYAFQYKAEAVEFHKTLSKRLGKFNLEVAEEKTNIVKFSRFETTKNQAINFLGFEFRWGLCRKGKPTIKVKTASKKLKASILNFKIWIRENRNLGTRSIMNTVHKKLIGHYNYFGIRGNIERLSLYFIKIKELLFKWLNRRSQRKSYNVEKFLSMIEYYKMPSARITDTMSYYDVPRLCE